MALRCRLEGAPVPDPLDPARSKRVYPRARSFRKPADGGAGNAQDLLTFLRWMHADEILVFASDFPHWDWDSPADSLPRLPEPMRRRIFVENARELYGRKVAAPPG